ncbi:MAG: 4Fe-4S dicluster domain-containing protein [Desulfovibrio sp.]|nr:4Fe-4S dicluster domain-containing protein [Desulfovibrio sp.]
MQAFLPPLRPPGALAEKDFIKRCVRCGQCVTICPHKSIILPSFLGRHRGQPIIDPHKKPCYLCMLCPPSCPTGALDPTLSDLTRVRMGQAYIAKDRCHNYAQTGIMCMTCYDRCPLRGQAVVLAMGLNPHMTTACVGCGICVYVCPVAAVTVVPAHASWIPPFAEQIKPSPRKGEG